MDIQLRRVSRLLVEKGYHFEVTEAAREYLAEVGYDLDFVARPAQTDNLARVARPTGAQDPVR